MKRLRFTPVFCFHSIVDNPSPDDGFAFSLKDFEKLAAWLSKEGFKTIPMSEYLSGGLFSPGHVVLSFDDGYSNFNTLVAPVLGEYGFGATIFVTPFFDPAYAPFKPQSVREHRLFLKEEFLEAAALPEVEIGAHSLTHRNLPDLPDSELEEEVRGCREYLEKLIGKPVTSFAYPRNQYDGRVIEVVRKSGYKTGVAGVSIEEGRYVIPRIHAPQPFSASRARVKALGFGPLLSYLTGRVGK